MPNKVEETRQRLKDLEYFASADLAKVVMLFEASGKRNNRSIPTLLLGGKSGAGKTYLAETFAKMIGAKEKFVQCFPRMGAENFQLDVNMEGFIKQDPDNVIKPGVLLQALEASKESPVVLTIDELDKARPEVDSFLLDFLENGRLSTGTDTYTRGKFPIYTIITSNGKREIDEALINRSKKVEVPRPDKDLFLEILGLPDDHYMSYIYDKCQNFSIRQARQYLEDLEVLGTEFDEQALSQYINFDELDVMSLDDLQRVASIEDGTLEFEMPELSRCRIRLDMGERAWANILQGHNFRLSGDEYNNLYVDVLTIEELQKLNGYMDYKSYDAWFEYQPQKTDSKDDKIMWASEKSARDGTRLGIKIDGDTMYKIATFKGKQYVYLNSDECRLEDFLHGELQNSDVEYETDDEYGDNGRDYDD